MRKILLLFLIFLTLNTLPVFGVSFEKVQDAEKGISETAASNIDMVAGNFSFYDMAKSIYEGSYSSDLRGIIQKGIDMLFEEVRVNVKIMGSVMLLGILCSFLSNLASSFGSGEVTEAAFLCCYALLAGMSATGFSQMVSCTTETINDMSFFMKSLIPLMSMLSAAEGKVITASLMHTEILMATALSSFVIEKVVLPLLYASFALKFINNITKSLSLTNLVRMADKLTKRILGFTFLVFTAVLSLSSFAAGTAENMGMKTARFAVSSVVPVAGGVLADSVSAITASCGMIKNSAGIAGITVIFLMAAYPVIKCAAVSFIYNFTGAVLEPVCDTRLSVAVTSVGECMGMLFGIISVCAAQCIISSAILLSTVRG